MMKKLLSLAVSVLLLTALSACNGGSSSGNSSGNNASAALEVDFNSASGNTNAKAAKALASAISDIAMITVDVIDGSTYLANGKQLTNTGGIWSTTISNLPTGVQLTVLAHAYDGAAAEIFTGTTYKTLTGDDDHIEIVMDSVANAASQQFPKITLISSPAQIALSSAVPVSFVMQGNSGEVLAYEITAAASNGSFSPTSGNVTVGVSTVSLVTVYTAPTATGTYTHRIKVTNSQGNIVETSFTTNVENLSSSDVIVLFNPAITSVSASRSGSEVTFLAGVSDSGPSNQLTYNWSFDGGLSFTNSAANPAVLQGYDENVAGTLSLTVANGSGRSTTVSFAITPGQFPNSAATNLMYIPQTINTTGRAAWGDTSVSGSIITMAMNESGDQQDYNNDGDMDDNVLGYYNVSTGATVNTGISAEFASIGGDIIAFLNSDTGTLGYYSISANTWTDTEIPLSQFSSGDSNHFVSNGKIVYVSATRDLNGDTVPDLELNIYDTNTDLNSQTGVPAANEWDVHPSFNGNIVSFQNINGNISYYNVGTGQTTDTGIAGWEPAIDNGTIVFNSTSGFVAYYVIGTGKYVLTPIFSDGPMPSISNGIIAVAASEWVWGKDLNGDGDLDEPVVVLYDIPTGRMINTGLVKHHWGEISNEMIEYRAHESDLQTDLNGDGDLDDPVHVYVFLNDLAKSYFSR